VGVRAASGRNVDTERSWKKTIFVSHRSVGHGKLPRRPIRVRGAEHKKRRRQRAASPDFANLLHADLLYSLYTVGQLVSLAALQANGVEEILITVANESHRSLRCDFAGMGRVGDSGGGSQTTVVADEHRAAFGIGRDLIDPRREHYVPGHEGEGRGEFELGAALGK
jgi:hypothetical protein